MPKTNQEHIPVLLDEVLRYLAPKAGQSYLDVTAGYGGHAAAVLAITKAPQKAVLVDRDPMAGQALQKRFKGTRIIGSDFLKASRELTAEGLSFDMILADLGVSSPHLDIIERGFGFAEAPLDMRMDQRQELTAAEIVNRWGEDKLAATLAEFGQEPKSRQIARLIVNARPLKTTDQLAKLVTKAWPHGSKRHPATRTFQALRIAVNDELSQLQQALPLWVEMLAPGGRLVVISFHSLEDKIVKQFLAEQATAGYEATLTIMTKKPLTPSPLEIALNPRARSAKLRAASKIKTKRKDKTVN